MEFKKMDIPALAIEVNTLTPDARYAGQQSTGGLFDHPNAAIILPADGYYPDRISIGLPAESLISGYHRLQTWLEKMAADYPVILLDAAPILNSADTEYFASICDIVLVLIAAKQTKPDRLKRALKLLERIEPKAVGFVVSRLEIFQGGGYYAATNRQELPLLKAVSGFFAKWFNKFAVRRAQ